MKAISLFLTLISTIEAHDIDLNRPPLFDRTVPVIPANSNDIPGYRQTTEGWSMENRYVLTADTFTVTHTVSYSGTFESAWIIQPFTQW